ncbi:unnamed protein product [Cyprideis torosa]|uniref:Uncharacterized protein n=1 Tax=Cyprideis torosa TaxID=163714 RepID=A0A7R8ZQT0_9CRUS|nr:unnamed protein product [Cyprideis torosa]CAG0892698.1 unnamed protein product [Cyprideis torosa]
MTEGVFLLSPLHQGSSGIEMLGGDPMSLTWTYHHLTPRESCSLPPQDNSGEPPSFPPASSIDIMPEEERDEVSSTENEEDQAAMPPPSETLSSRRRALLPPKMPGDVQESEEDPEKDSLRSSRGIAFRVGVTDLLTAAPVAEEIVLKTDEVPSPRRRLFCVFICPSVASVANRTTIMPSFLCSGNHREEQRRGLAPE